MSCLALSKVVALLRPDPNDSVALKSHPSLGPAYIFSV